jgi:Zn ribbon nucleic-acid-binding protein
MEMATTYLFKGCPRCGGDLLLTEELDNGAKYFSCVQCGHSVGVAKKQVEHLSGAPAAASRQTRSSRRAA